MGFSLRVLSLVCALMPFVNARGREYDGLDLQCLDATLVQTCDDILIGHLQRCESFTQLNDLYCLSGYTDADEEHYFNVTISNTVPFQPNITLEVNSLSDTFWKDGVYINYPDGEGYVIGYRDCSSNSTELCYVYIDTLPGEVNDWTHVIFPPRNSPALPVGDQCTFFGCFQYCLFPESGCIKARRDFLKENITILGTCPELEISNGNTSVIITPEEPTLEGHYVEGTIVTVSCKEGYIGSGNSTCQRNGNWTLASCSLITCPNPDRSFDNSNISAIITPEEPTLEGHYVEGTIVTVSCFEGYDGGGDSICQRNGTWTSVSCLWSVNDNMDVAITLLTTLVPTAVFVLGLCFTIYMWKEYQSRRNDRIQVLNNMFAIQMQKEILDPTYVPVDVCPQNKLEPSLSSEDDHETLRQGLFLYSNIHVLKHIHNLKRSYSVEDVIAKANIAASTNIPKSSTSFGSCPGLEISTRKQDDEPKATHMVDTTAPYYKHYGCSESATSFMDCGITEHIVTPGKTEHTTTSQLDEPSSFGACIYVNSSAAHNDKNISSTMGHNSAASDTSIAFEMVNNAQHNDEQDKSISGYVCESEYKEKLKSGYICQSIHYNASETVSDPACDPNMSSLHFSYGNSEHSYIPVEFLLPQFSPLPPSPNEQTQSLPGVSDYVQLQDVAHFHEASSKPDDQVESHQSLLS